MFEVDIYIGLIFITYIQNVIKNTYKDNFKRLY